MRAPTDLARAIVLPWIDGIAEFYFDPMLPTTRCSVVAGRRIPRWLCHLALSSLVHVGWGPLGVCRPTAIGARRALPTSAGRTRRSRVGGRVLASRSERRRLPKTRHFAGSFT